MIWVLRGVIIRSQPGVPTTTGSKAIKIAGVRTRCKSELRFINEGSLSVTIPLPTCLATSMRTIRIFSGFFGVILAWSITAGSPVIGKAYSLKLMDVDGRTLSTSDNIVTVLVLTTRTNLGKAREVGDRIPERCLGNPHYRMITVIQFGNTRT